MTTIEANCEDCGRSYGHEHGFPDLIIPLDTWRQISTHGDETGLLCPSCICKRLDAKGLRCEGAFMSGPIRSVSPEMMSALRWIENLREQGHGWNCPKCGEHRNRNTLSKEERDKAKEWKQRVTG